MKKLFYIVSAICAILASCAKEIDEIPANADSKSEKTVLPENIPASLSALYDEESNDELEAESESESKTSYSGNIFSWVLNDEVALYFVDNLTIPENQGWIAYQASTINGATATFSVKDGQTDKATELSSYYNSGVAIYPTSIARPALANSESCAAYSSPFVTVKSSVSGNASDIILIGSSDDSSVFHFKTAMGVLKVTVTGIPAQASALQLISNDQDNYPLCGDFKLNIGGDLEIKQSDYLKYYGFHTGAAYLNVDLSSEGDIASRDFYFNIPTGDYAKGAFTIKLVDSDGNSLLEKKLNKAWTFNRNDLVSTPTPLANEWVTLGVGRFVDNFLWSKIVAKGLDKDIPDYVNVTIQQSISDANKFRLVDPYGVAATQFGYSSSNSDNRDKYLVFTVAGSTSGSAVTDYTTHRTGLAIDAYDYNPELVYPTTYGENNSTEQNKVLIGDGTLPMIVQFAPAYHYSGYAMNNSYTYPRFNNKGIFRIIFPGVTNYGGSLSLPTTGDAQLNKLEVIKQSNPGRIIGYVSQYPDYEIAGSKAFNSVSPGVSTGANSTCTWNNTGLASNTSIPSGPVYLTWYTVDSSSLNEYYDQGRTKVYYINKTDFEAVCNQHTTSGNKGYSSDGEYTGSYTFAVSENPLNSNIKMIEFDGMTADVTGMDLASTHQIYSSLYWIAPGTTTYTGADPVFTNGTAQYGVLSGSSILLDATKPFFKRGSVNIYVYSYTDYAGGGRGAANNPERFKFTLNNGKVNVGETYVNARFDGNNQASAPYANTILED